jgi:hypothetical protein
MWPRQLGPDPYGKCMKFTKAIDTSCMECESYHRCECDVMIQKLSKLHEHLAVIGILKYLHCFYHLKTHKTRRWKLFTIVQEARSPALTQSMINIMRVMLHPACIPHTC